MPVRSILLAALLFVAAPVAAQQQAIQAQMTPEEFRAAGLDKLSAEELASLNAWLGRTIAHETERAASQAEAKVAEERRDFTSGSSDPIQARIVGEFRGFGHGHEYTLDNGHVWRQVDDARLSGVRLDNPAVRLTSSVIGNAWYLKVEGYNTRAKVVRVR